MHGPERARAVKILYSVAVTDLRHPPISVTDLRGHRSPRSPISARHRSPPRSPADLLADWNAALVDDVDVVEFIVFRSVIRPFPLVLWYYFFCDLSSID